VGIDGANGPEEFSKISPWLGRETEIVRRNILIGGGSTLGLFESGKIRFVSLRHCHKRLLSRVAVTSSERSQSAEIQTSQDSLAKDSILIPIHHTYLIFDIRSYFNPEKTHRAMSSQETIWRFATIPIAHRTIRNPTNSNDSSNNFAYQSARQYKPHSQSAK
jgi:hypothetical protein